MPPGRLAACLLPYPGWQVEERLHRLVLLVVLSDRLSFSLLDLLLRQWPPDAGSHLRPGADTPGHYAITPSSRSSSWASARWRLVTCTYLPPPLVRGCHTVVT